MLWPPASRTVWHSQFYVCSLSVSHHWDASTMHHSIQSILFTIEKSWLTKQCLGFGERIEKNGKVDSWINETKLERPEQPNWGGGVPELCPGTWTWPKGHGNRWVACRHVTELAGRVLLAEAFEHLGFFLTPSVTHIDKRPHPYHSWEAPASSRRWSSLSACKQLFNYMTNFSFLRNHYWLNFKGLETFILLSYSRTSYSQIFKQKLKWHSELQYEASPQSFFFL